MKPLCHYCGLVEATTSDHIIPRSRGGADAQYNRVPSCKPCNEAKGAANPTCQCFTCRAAVNMPRVQPRLYRTARAAKKAKAAKKNRPDNYPRYPATD